MEQLQLAFESLQEAWAQLIDTFAEIWERIKQIVSDAWAAITDLLCFWNCEEQENLKQSYIEEVDSSKLFQYNNFAD